MLIVSNIVSLDGYVAAADGNSTVLPMDGAFDAYNAERLRTADTLLVGANSYRGFASFWPRVLREPETVVDEIHAQLGGAVDRAEIAARITSGAPQEVARRNDAVAKVVVSDRLDPDDLGAWRDTTRIVRRADAHAAVAALPGETLVFGSRTLWNDLLAAGLVDELHLMVGPVVLGDGVRAFDAPPPALRLAGTRRFDGSDNVVLTYEVTRP
ncbi:MAG TPA: dihydrofolate reductase family protein [Mycobacteriales bacterium]